MEERDLVAPRAGPGLLVDEVDAEVAGAVERPREVVGRERDVVDPRSLAVEVVGDGPALGGLEQFEVPAVGQFEEDHPHPVERLLVDDRPFEQLREQVGEVGGVARGDAGVIEAHESPLGRRRLIRIERGGSRRESIRSRGRPDGKLWVIAPETSERTVSDQRTDVPTEQKTSRNVLDTILEGALHEMNRERSGLLLSGLSAGLDIGFGPLMMAVVLTLSPAGFGDLTTELLLASVYSIGFMFVILGRSELFTEHTTLAVIPVLDGQASLRDLGRLWGLVYVGNLVGGLLFTLLVILLMPELGVVTPAAFETIATKLVSHDLPWLFVGGVFAGWLMGLLAWLITAAQETTSRLILVLIVTGTIGLLHLPHSIAGNVEVLFGLFMSPTITLADYVGFLVLATIGNAFGGAVFVALLKYGHVVRGAS